MKFGKQANPVFVRNDHRGEFKELVNFGEWRSLITGSMNAGAVMGRHYHNYTVLYFHLLSGAVEVKTLNRNTGEKVSLHLYPGEGYIFRPEEIRVILYLENSRFLILKSHPYDPQNPDLIEYPEDF